MADPRFVFLVLEEHPFGREMLRRLLDAGFKPALVIEERSAVADEELTKFLDRIRGHPVAPTIESLCRQHGVERVSVPIHNDENCLSLIAPIEPELLVLGGTRIIRGRLLESAPNGVINSHPGLLPDCRGSASPAWSVYHDIPIGASTHFCDAGIDTGELLLRREIPVRRGDTYEDLCYQTLVLAGALMVEALQAYVAGGWDAMRRPQGESRHPTFRTPPPEVLEVVRRKLADHSYAHYAD